MSNGTDNKSFGSGLIAVNEVRKRMFYITYDIIVFFYLWLYDIVYDVYLPYTG